MAEFDAKTLKDYVSNHIQNPTKAQILEFVRANAKDKRIQGFLFFEYEEGLISEKRLISYVRQLHKGGAPGLIRNFRRQYGIVLFEKMLEENKQMPRGYLPSIGIAILFPEYLHLRNGVQRFENVRFDWSENMDRFKFLLDYDITAIVYERLLDFWPRNYLLERGKYRDWQLLRKFYEKYCREPIEGHIIGRFWELAEEGKVNFVYLRQEAITPHFLTQLFQFRGSGRAGTKAYRENVIKMVKKGIVEKRIGREIFDNFAKFTEVNEWREFLYFLADFPELNLL